MTTFAQSVYETVSFPVINRPVRRVAFGCEPLGGYNWGGVDPEEIAAAASEAISSGPILLDTADCYGPNASEVRLGEVLEQCADAKRNAVIATKFGVRVVDGSVFYDNDPGYADQALDASLARLRINKIDLYQLHWPDAKTPLPKIFAKLETFREEGRIGAYGVSNIPASTLSEFKPNEWPGLASFSLSYSLIDRKQEKSIDRLMQTHGLAFIAFGCLAQGLLSGKYGRDTVFPENDRRRHQRYSAFHGSELESNLEIVDALMVEAKSLGQAPTAIALSMILRKFPNSIALAGIKSRSQLRQNLTALESKLTLKSLERLLNASDKNAG